MWASRHLPFPFNTMYTPVLISFPPSLFSLFYSRTSTGKTHTMEGAASSAERGIIPNSFQHIFERVAVSENQQFLVRASYLEIYNEEIRDLLSKDPRNKLELKEHPDRGMYVKDLTTFVVKNAEEIDKVMQAGKRNRSTGATLMNQTSSRSHSVFTIIVECCDSSGNGLGSGASSKHQRDHPQQQIIRVGKLNLVDLAGSERQSKTGTTGERFKEATKINLSLSALGNVISALVDGRAQHVPYRDSKLTRLLQSSLGGNTKTVMCANCGPADYNYDETLSTLRYANRAKNIKNKPHVNEDPKDAMLREFQEEILRLKAQLAAQDKLSSGFGGSGSLAVGAVPDGTAQAKDDNDDAGDHKQHNRRRSSGGEKQWREVAVKAEKEKEELKSQAKRDMDALQSKSSEEKEALRQRLLKEAEDRRALESKLHAMEAKLIQGGESMDKANHDKLMRQAKGEVDAQQQQQRRLAQELAIKEETHLVLEEQYSSLQEEVDAKTRKLHKLVTKYRAATRDNQDLQAEFQREREDLLETVRQLTRQLKLKELVVQHFVPPEVATIIEQRATWSEERDAWIVPFLRLAGNNLRRVDLRRRVASPTSRRPETQYARTRRNHDKDTRFRVDNLLDLELDMEDGAPPLQHYSDAVAAGPGAEACRPPVLRVLDMALDDDGPVSEEEEQEEDRGPLPPSSPYLRYADHHQESPTVAAKGRR